MGMDYPFCQTMRKSFQSDFHPFHPKERNRDEGTCADAAGAELFLPRTATQLRDVGTSIANGEILVLFRL